MTTMIPAVPAVSTQEETWTIDPDHSHVEFAVKHMMIATVKGRFADVSGSVVVTGRDPSTARVEATIAASSVTTGTAQRDAHLRSEDFFDVERYPVLTFRSRRVERMPQGDLRMIGDLAIRGVTREVALAVEEIGRATDPWGGERAGFSATTRISRREFGLTWNQLLETGGVAVSDEVRIALEIELVRSPDATD